MMLKENATFYGYMDLNFSSMTCQKLPNSMSSPVNRIVQSMNDYELYHILLIATTVIF